MFSSYFFTLSQFFTSSLPEKQKSHGNYPLPWDEFATISHLRGTTHVRKALVFPHLSCAFNAAPASAYLRIFRLRQNAPVLKFISSLCDRALSR